MPKDQACKLQILSGKHREILTNVDMLFDLHCNLKQVQRAIEAKFGETVGMTAISSYKKNHYNVKKRMVSDQKASMKGIAEIIGEDGLDVAVNALLWEQLQQLTPQQLVGFKRVLNDTAKVEVMKKQVALQAAEHRQKMKERREAAARAGEEYRPDPAEDYAKAQRVVAQVKEIFGIGMAEYAPSQQKSPGAASESATQSGPAGTQAAI